MPNDDIAPHKRLARHITNIIAGGFRLTDDVWDFISATDAEPNPAYLKSLLKPPISDESEPLLELIFFPDETMQARLEVALNRQTVSARDEGQLIDFLKGLNLATTIIIARLNQTIETVFPVEILPLFVTRLCITKTLDHKLADAIDTHVSEKLRNILKVRIRNVPYPFLKTHITFFKEILARLQPKTHADLAWCDFLINFLATCPIEKSIAAQLQQHHEKCCHNLKAAQAFEARLAQSNLETMLAQGFRQPHHDVIEIQKSIVIIERILFAIGTGLPRTADSAVSATIMHPEDFPAPKNL
jgi:hypothetical protein